MNYKSGDSEAPGRKLLEMAFKDRNLKVKSEVCPFNNKYVIHDISIGCKGPMEDRKYADNLWYLNNIRRGNSVIEIEKHGDMAESKTFICRKGLKKFFDFYLEYFDYTPN